MSSLDARSSLAGPRASTARRRAALLLLAIAAATAAVRAAPAIRWASEQARAGSELSRADRELAPARAVDLDTRPFVGAAELIPLGDTFHVVIADDYPFTYDVSRFSAPGFATYWLFPRLQTEQAADADWIISYGVAPAEVGVAVDGTTDLGAGVTLMRVRR